MKRRLVFLILSLIVLFNFAACRGQSTGTVIESAVSVKESEAIETDEDAADESEEIPFYTDEQLDEIAGFEGSLDEIRSYYPPSYSTERRVVKSMGASDFSEMTVLLYIGETKLIELLFDESGNRESDLFHEMTVPSSAFDSLVVGMTLSDVQAIDPKGEYWFLYTGTGRPRISSHYTTDDFLFNISYDDSNIITDIVINSFQSLYSSDIIDNEAVFDEYNIILNDYRTLVEYRFSDSDWESTGAPKMNDKLEADLKQEYTASNGEVSSVGYHWGCMFGEMDSLLSDEGTADSFGYILEDINDDGIPELFWVDEEHNILAVFTIVDGEAKLIDAHWPRHRCVLTDSKQLYTRSSGGAYYVTHEIKELDPMGNVATVLEFGVDGVRSEEESNYYKLTEEGRTPISKAERDELLSEYPFEHTKDWMNKPILRLNVEE